MNVLDETIQIMNEEGFISKPKLSDAQLYCKNSKMGEYKCSVKNREGFCCDVCLQDEILSLRSKGIHTIASCCGHGDITKACILIVTEESEVKMKEMGYEICEKRCLKDRMSYWKPKSILIYKY